MRTLFKHMGSSFAALAAMAILFMTLLAQPAASEESATVEEILGILLDRGLIDEVEHTKLIRKHRQEKNDQKTGLARLTDGMEWSGDLRLRYEAFYYDDDSFGNDPDNRYRFRYRARFGFKKKINDWLSVGLRLASGTDDSRSRNRTLGDDEDFDPDEVFIDLAWADVTLPSVAGLEHTISAGKVSNPFRWRKGKDVIVWDSDLTPEGAVWKGSLEASESTRLFARLGAFILDENSASKDPKVFAAQIGGETRLGGLELGWRASGYEWRSLDRQVGRVPPFTAPANPAGDLDSSFFVDRAVANGNLVSAFDGRARIGELATFVGFSPTANWPVLVYGALVRNFTADSVVLGGIPIDEEDTAWGAGIEVGSASQLVKLGAGYFHVEANAVVAQFTDSNLFDGFTNRRGWIFYLSRALADNVSVNLAFYDSDSIKNTGGSAGPFAFGSSGADRKRLQTDLVVQY